MFCNDEETIPNSHVCHRLGKLKHISGVKEAIQKCLVREIAEKCDVCPDDIEDDTPLDLLNLDETWIKTWVQERFDIQVSKDATLSEFGDIFNQM